MFDINSASRSISKELDQEFTIYNSASLQGGDINLVYKITTSFGDMCLKVNDNSAYPNLFEKEMAGLEILIKSNSIQIAKPITHGVFGEQAFLLMDFIRAGKPNANFWQNFGLQLSELHKTTNDKFGFEHDNYIGSLFQMNNQCETWSEFFFQFRLEPLLLKARNNGLVDGSIVKSFERFSNRVPEIFPEEPPALLHGDLWNGNYMVNEEGNPVLIDPAVYFGHREMDLAMTKLFGGFDRILYQSYNENYPLEKDWLNRVDYCNLYPLLVHLNLFGHGYRSSIEQIIKKF